MPYVPGVVPPIESLEDLQAYLQDELAAISQDLIETDVLELRQRFVEPTKPRAGMIVSADGMSWNPGAGAGAYEYKGGAWVKL